MKNSGAIFLILGGLTGLYLYNTGRAAAVVAVLKNPATPTQGGVPGTSVAGGSGGGGSSPISCAQDVACFDRCAPNDTACIAACVSNMDCLDGVFGGGGGGNSIWDDIGDIASIFLPFF